MAGYGRSGSTLLERILNCNKKLFALGEIANLLSLINDRDSLCSCEDIFTNVNFGVI
jgi:hypothetical protein